MSKKLFYARGQRDAARGAKWRLYPGVPHWVEDAYRAGYLAVLVARANREVGKYIISRNSNIDAPSIRPELKEWERGPMISTGVTFPANCPPYEDFYFEDGDSECKGFWK